MTFANRILLLRDYARERCAFLESPLPSCTLVFSVSDGDMRAETLHATGSSFDAVWKEGLVRLRRRMGQRKLKGRFFRLDWVESAEEMAWASFEQALTQSKRNYFRFGLALDQEFSVLLTEQECNANALFYGGSQITHAVFNPDNFTTYLKRRAPGFTFSHMPERVWKIAMAGAFCDEEGILFPLPGPEGQGAKAGLETGHRPVPVLEQNLLVQVIDRSSRWLAKQVQPSGKYVYGYFPCFDRLIGTYNTLRHASSTYALLEAWEYTGNPELEAPLRRAVDYLARKLISVYDPTPGQKAAFLVEEQAKEIKLGGNGVSLLALVKWTELSGSREYLPLMELLAEGILMMRDPDTGGFVHVLNSTDLSLKEKFRIIYYDGEAVFGLLRLYHLTGNERWLNAAIGFFDEFLNEQHAEAHDHWLSYSVNELTRCRPEERYFRFGIRNFSGYLDFVLNRETTFPTLLELMMAAQDMLERMADLPELQHLLDGVDLEKFSKARDFRARYLLNGFFWPEMAMFFKNPDRIRDSFFIRHHAFRIRIDDVEHYLSGLIAYARMLERGTSDIMRAKSLWTEGRLQQVTSGIWDTPPATGWGARAICAWKESFVPGDMLLARSLDSVRGLPEAQVHTLAPKASGIICTEPARWREIGLPLLVVEDAYVALLALAEEARRDFQGKVLGVTGSSGKTTVVAMLHHVLSARGLTEKTLASANMLYGVAWNLAAMSREADWWIVEMALAGMDKSSPLTRPDVAVVINVSEAHLKHWKNVENIAHQKSKIFTGMKQGGLAAINRDMEQFFIFAAAAEKNEVEVLTFGRHQNADLRLLDHDPKAMRFMWKGEKFQAVLPMPGLHIAMNSLAVLGGLAALGLQPLDFLDELAEFQPLAGRGERHSLNIGGKQVLLVDESFNANPASMRAALSAFAPLAPEPETRLLIMGDMLELDEASAIMHASLEEPICAAQPDRVLLCGPEMRLLWDHLKEKFRGQWYPDMKSLQDNLLAWIRDGDHILLKGSHGTELWKLVKFLRSHAV